MTIVLARHVLRDGSGVKTATVLMHSVLSVFMGVQDRLVARAEPLEGVHQHLSTMLSKGRLPVSQATISPLHRPMIGERYIITPPALNSVTSVTHFSLR